MLTIWQHKQLMISLHWLSIIVFYYAMIYYESHKLNSLLFPHIKSWLALYKIQPPER